MEKLGLIGLFIVGGPVLFLNSEKIIKSQEIHAEAQLALSKLNDYSFKILLPCRTSGTGWILDYEIPKDKGVYPTTWYIATNAHVANRFKFGSNDYRQELPKYKEKNKGRRDKFKFKNLPLDSTNSCNFKRNGYFDFNLLRQENGKQLRSNYGAISNDKMEEPKLFYVPINFLKQEKWKEDNYKDFAVIQVKFKTSEYAKEATGDFYGKYSEGSRKPLGIFPQEREWPKKEEYLKNNKYSLGYEGRKGFQYSFSYDGQKTSKIAIIKGITDLEGRVSATKHDNRDVKITKWNGRNLKRVGHFYLLKNFAMNRGVSGGLVIDGNGYILGVKSLASTNKDRSLVVPIRSEEVNNDLIKTPKYDLILGGGEDQISSYKEQVVKYILNAGKRTWLSQRGGWRRTERTNAN